MTQQEIVTQNSWGLFSYPEGMTDLHLERGFIVENTSEAMELSISARVSRAMRTRRDVENIEVLIIPMDRIRDSVLGLIVFQTYVHVARSIGRMTQPITVRFIGSDGQIYTEVFIEELQNKIYHIDPNSLAL